MLTSEDLRQLSSLLDEKFEKNNAILRAEIVQSAESVKTELRAEIAQTTEILRAEINQSAESVKAELRAEIAQTTETLRSDIAQSNAELREATSMSISQLHKDMKTHHNSLKSRLLCGYAYQIHLLASA